MTGVVPDNRVVSVEHLVERYEIDLASAQTLCEYGFDPDTFDRLRERLRERQRGQQQERLREQQQERASDGSHERASDGSHERASDGSQGRISDGSHGLRNTDADRIQTDHTQTDPIQDNRIQVGRIEPPAPGDIEKLPSPGSKEHADLVADGRTAIAAGEVAVMVLAGGMATRFGGGVKALAKVVGDLTFVDSKLAATELAAGELAGVASTPFWLMTSFRSHSALESWAENARKKSRIPIAFAPQSVSMRLRADGEIFFTEDGEVSLYAPGHGDVSYALQRSGLLANFISNGGKHVFVSNVDNIAATLDPAIIGAHRQAGKPITCEITTGSEVGGSPWRVDGKLQIVEQFRLPPELADSDAAGGNVVGGDAVGGASADGSAAGEVRGRRLINTNSLIIDTETLAADHPLTWFEVRKKVASTADITGTGITGIEVVQFERLIGELTAPVDTTMLLVERDGPNGRFQPVKDQQELQDRQHEIELILRARKIIS